MVTGVTILLLVLLVFILSVLLVVVAACLKTKSTNSPVVVLEANQTCSVLQLQTNCTVRSTMALAEDATYSRPVGSHLNHIEVQKNVAYK